jgi:hypothetical protein
LADARRRRERLHATAVRAAAIQSATAASAGTEKLLFDFGGGLRAGQLRRRDGASLGTRRAGLAMIRESCSVHVGYLGAFVRGRHGVCAQRRLPQRAACLSMSISRSSSAPARVEFSRELP